VNQSPTNPSPEESSPSSPPRHVPTRGLYGWITHTELASSDPASTKAWCSKVLGWTFKPSRLASPVHSDGPAKLL
jgi:hypothetical protein